MDLTAHLTKQDIEEIVKEHLQAKYNIEVEEVWVNTGYDFHGVKVRFGEKLPSVMPVATQYPSYMIPVKDMASGVTGSAFVTEGIQTSYDTK